MEIKQRRKFIVPLPGCALPVTLIALAALLAVVCQNAAADSADTVDDYPIVDLKIVKTTNKDNVPPDCGGDWIQVKTDLQAGGLGVGGGDFTEPAFYLCYKTGDPAVYDPITHLYPISQSSTGGIGRNGCYGDDKKVKDSDGKSDVNRGGWKEQEDRLCYGIDGDYPLLGIKIKPYLSDINNYVYRKPNVNPKTGNGATGQTFNFGGTLLYVYTRDRSTTEDDFTFNCGGEGEDACKMDTEFWWTNGNGGCDRGLREVSGKCENGLWPFQRYADAVDDFMAGATTDGDGNDGDWVLWALDNQRTNLAVDEPLNWVMQLGAHNAFNNDNDGYVFDPNHTYSITDQLNLGARNIRIDVHDYNANIRLCHGMSDGTGCTLTDRLYFNAIKELGEWLRNNPGEFVIVKLEEYLSETDTEAVSVPIEKYIGLEDIYLHEDFHLYLTECIKGNKQCNPGDNPHRWPTLSELRKKGKQVMFIADQFGRNADGTSKFGTGIFTSVPPSVTENYGGTANAFFGGEGEFDEAGVDDGNPGTGNNCLDEAFWTDDLLAVDVSEDRTMSGLLVTDWPGILNADRVETLARCNINVIFDFINAQQFTPRDSIEDPCIHALRNGLADPCKDPDNRMAAAVWSWRPGDFGDNGDYAMLANSDKRWKSADGLDEHHFACAPERALDDPTQLADRSGADWKVTSTIGPWEDGGPACALEFGSGYVFNVPVNGWQNEKLKAALKDAKNESDFDESSNSVWLNYRKGKDHWVKGRSFDAKITVVEPAYEGTPGAVYNSGQIFKFNGEEFYFLNHKWELKNIDEGTTVVLADNNVTGFFPQAIQFEKSGNYEIHLTTTDQKGQSGFDYVSIKVKNFAPTADFGGIESVFEDNDGWVEFTNEFDLGIDDEAAGYTYSYDFDNDGGWEIEDSSSSYEVVPASYLDDGPSIKEIKGRIKDKDGGFTEYVHKISVENVAPTASFSATQTSAPVSRTAGTSDSTQSFAQVQRGLQRIDTNQLTLNEGETTNLFSNPVDAPRDVNNGLRIVYYGKERGQQVTDNPDPGLTGTLLFDCLGYQSGSGDRPPFAYYANGIAFGQSSCIFADGPKQQAVSAWLIDEDDDYTAYSGTVSVVNVPPTVETPVVNPPAPYEGDSVSATARFTDPGVEDEPLTCTVNYGDGSGDQAGTVSIEESLLEIVGTCTGPGHAYADNGSYTVTIKVADKDHSASIAGQGSNSTVVAVNNVDPILELSVTPIDENGIAQVMGMITDPGSADTFTLELDWGEGAPVEYTYGAGTTSFSETHQYLDDNPTGTPSDDYTISGTVTDKDGGSGSDSTTLKVSNLDPVASIISVKDNLTGLSVAYLQDGVTVPGDIDVVLVGTMIEVDGNYTDVGTLDTHSAVINWDDSSGDEAVTLFPDSPNNPQNGVIDTASHAYATDLTPDLYTIVLTVTDDDTGSDTPTAGIEVVDAAGALADALQDIQDVIDGGGLDPAAELALYESLYKITGNPGDDDGDGDGNDENGALDKLERDNLNATLVKIKQAIGYLEDAEAADASLDLAASKAQLTLTAKSVVQGAIDDANAAATKNSELKKIADAEALMASGDANLSAGDYVAALEDYIDAVRKVESIIN